jgi:hypothetical protein
MPSLSERLKARDFVGAREAYLPREDFLLALKVCAAVEAFQAAEQRLAALRAAPKPYEEDGHYTAYFGERVAAEAEVSAAKARLLEVYLG